jgi:hypothetical protein
MRAGKWSRDINTQGIRLVRWDARSDLSSEGPGLSGKIWIFRLGIGSEKSC